jgi:hypothetical protein
MEDRLTLTREWLYDAAAGGGDAASIQMRVEKDDGFVRALIDLVYLIP